MKRRAAPMTFPAAVEAVKAIYRELAERPIERSCIARTECCQFRLTGRTPFLTKGEALVAAKAVRASGRKQLPESADGACPLLDRATGRCRIYEGRPFGCRTHFCAAAGGPYARGEVVDLIHRLEAIDTALGGNGAMALPIALEKALREI
jgi:Fe-S-cluster containining protein